MCVEAEEGKRGISLSRGLGGGYRYIERPWWQSVRYIERPWWQSVRYIERPWWQSGT